MRSRRGAIEVQFNWIFVMIVGAILLLFFYSIVKAQQKSSDQSVGYTISTDLNAILSSSAESTGTLNVVDVPKTDIVVTCNDYSVNDVPRRFNNKIVFSPDRLRGNQLISWAIDWNVPFKVTNLLMLTVPDVRYIVVGDGSAKSDELKEILPDELEVEYIAADETGDVQDLNDMKVRFVYFDDPKSNIYDFPSELSGMPDEDVSAVSLNAALDEHGEVIYYQKSGSGTYEWKETGRSEYLRIETAIGAMFAEDAEMYECSFKKALERLGIVAGIYVSRTEGLIAHAQATGRNSCLIQYDVTAIEALEDAEDPGDSESLFDQIDNLNYANDYLKRHSCPLMY